MFFIDPLYLILALPGIALGLWAQWRVRSTFNRYAQVGTQRGLSGAEVAAEILRTEGITDVRIEPTEGWLSDHYSPRDKTLRLSPDVFRGQSIAAAGVAAHEVGHAIQHARSYPFLGMRSALVPAVQLASPFAVPVILVGFFLSAFMGSTIGQLVTVVGLALFALVVLFQLVTLPVELDASRRAIAAIRAGHLLGASESDAAQDVLRAAAWTYVAAAVSSLLTLLYFVLRSGLLGGRRH